MSTNEAPDIAEALMLVARELDAPRDLEGTLQAIVESAQRSMPGIDHVGISISHRSGEIETKAATGELVWKLDSIQYDVGQGPCVYAVERESVVRLEHAPQDGRWPDYLPAAVDMGLRSQLGLGLFNDDETLGGLNMYSTSSDTI